MRDLLKVCDLRPTLHRGIQRKRKRENVLGMVCICCIDMRSPLSRHFTRDDDGLARCEHEWMQRHFASGECERGEIKRELLRRLQENFQRNGGRSGRGEDCILALHCRSPAARNLQCDTQRSRRPGTYWLFGAFEDLRHLQHGQIRLIDIELQCALRRNLPPFQRKQI